MLTCRTNEHHLVRTETSGEAAEGFFLDKKALKNREKNMVTSMQQFYILNRDRRVWQGSTIHKTQLPPLSLLPTSAPSAMVDAGTGRIAKIEE